MMDTLPLGAPALMVFGLLSAGLSLLAFAPYIRDILTGRTRPQRASWLVWSVLSVLALVSQIYEGAGASLLFAGVQASCTVLIFILASSVSTSERLKRTDHLIFFAAGMGLVLWYFTSSAVYTLMITVSISLLAGTATVLKAYRDPGSETLVTWAVCFVGSCFAVLSVGKFDPVLLIYPVYLVVLYGAILCAITLGRVRRNRFLIQWFTEPQSKPPLNVQTQPPLCMWSGAAWYTSEPVNDPSAPVRTQQARP